MSTTLEAKDIGKILGAAALATLPTVTGLYVFGKMKDKRNSTGAAALTGGLTATVLGIAVGLLNYYMFGLDETTAQLTSLIGASKTDVSGLRGLMQPKYAFGSGSFNVGAVPGRVYSPFGDNFRNLGLLNVTRLGRVGTLDVQRRVGCADCGR